MDDLRVGRLIRAIRVRRGWRQQDLAAEAGVARSLVSRAERGDLPSLRLADLRSIAGALSVRLNFDPWWRSGDVDRVLNERHSLMQERLASMFGSLHGWEVAAEVTFSVYGERGSIDALAWHPARRALLVVELKTEITDPGTLIAQVDRYQRLAAGIGRERGWDATAVSAWVLVADSTLNRRRLSKHGTMLRNRFPLDGRTLKSWLRSPTGSVAALSFMAYDLPGSTARKAAPTKRVSRRRRGSREPEIMANAHGREH